MRKQVLSGFYITAIVLESQISNLVRTTSFWNNIIYDQNLKIGWPKNKDLNRIARLVLNKIVYISNIFPLVTIIPWTKMEYHGHNIFIRHQLCSPLLDYFMQVVCSISELRGKGLGNGNTNRFCLIKSQRKITLCQTVFSWHTFSIISKDILIIKTISITQSEIVINEAQLGFTRVNINTTFLLLIVINVIQTATTTTHILYQYFYIN